ncbi:hypothetical protein [Sinobaca sp. H24]|uniref:hypothetical protein n=1 Tax=Sinobaca sp. H24 TaxID=2923376 RepID=UPI0027E28A17|nr:hypothetical protein [Sinobaca sp. H24]
MERETIELFESASPSGLVIEAFARAICPAVVRGSRSTYCPQYPSRSCIKMLQAVLYRLLTNTRAEACSLKKKGVIFSNGLNGQKARLEINDRS